MHRVEGRGKCGSEGFLLERKLRGEIGVFCLVGWLVWLTLLLLRYNCIQ